jgi:hypothetical protein
MVKKIILDDIEYDVTNEEIIHSDEELIFEIKDTNGRTSFVKCLFEDMLGQPIENVWKIINH